MEGETIPGVNVTVIGTNIGTLSDVNGRYSITVPDQYATLLFTFVGYVNREHPVGNMSVIDVMLTEDTRYIEEVVVVGYGTQRRINLTGAVESISLDALENRPMTNLSRGMQGLIPNLNIIAYDGNPSRSLEFNVRGATSIGAGGAALVLIDGIEGDPNSLNPNDIESISVLKDASSAAIYGSRGAFGVVLITTKSPTKSVQMKLAYSGNYTINKRTIEPNLVTDGYTWAKMFNQAHYAWYNAYPTNINSAFPFSQEYLQELGRRVEDPNLPRYEISPANGRYVYYASHDWLKDLYSNSNVGTEHNLSISKSTGKSAIYLSGRLFDHDGIYRYNSDKYKTYNLRFKGSIFLTDWLEVFNNTDYSSMSYREPLYYGGFGFTSDIVMGWSLRSFPVSPMLNPDGSITEMGARSIGDIYYGKNHAQTQQDIIRNTFGFSASIFDKYLVLKGDYTFSKTFNRRQRFYSAVPYSNSPGVTTWLGDSRIFDHRTETVYNAINLYANSEFNLNNDHTFNLLAGFNGESSSMNYFEISREGLLFPDYPSFALATGSNYLSSQDLSEWEKAGFFARVNYNYKNRYLLELNGRYDGSSKFPATQRWGFFPSVSGAWRITEESFWNISQQAVSQLKIRASYGSLGNGNIRPYSYLESMPVSRSRRVIQGAYPTITSNPSVIPDGLTWEVATTVNLGIDMGFMNNRLTTSFDAYDRQTTNMFTPGPTLPDVFGADVPKGNYADMSTKGWEASIEWKDKTSSQKPFFYSIKAFMADNSSKITRYYNPDKLLTDYYEGMALGEIWGFVTEGLFVDQSDINSHVSQGIYRSNSTADMKPGDVKFKNLNGDNIISIGNNTVDDPGDRKIIGNSSPRYTYGVIINLEWNGFALSTFWQGVGKRDWYPPTESFYFWGQYNRPYSPIPKQMLGNMYDEDPENVNPNAYFPRMSGLSANNAAGLLRQPQTRYLQNAAYCRLKNLTVSYTIPRQISQKARLEKASIYFTGQNLLTFSPLFKHAENIDPELIEAINPDGGSAFGGGNGYPMPKSYTIGINLIF